MRLSILAFGDSITYGFCDYAGGGWVQQLRREFDQRNASEEDVDVRVYNLGISGEISDELAARFDRELTPRIRNGRCVVILATGINDARFLEDEQRFQSPPEHLERNVRSMLETAMARHAEVIVLGLTRVDEPRTTPTSWHPNLSYRNADIERYDAVLRSVSEAFRVPYVDLASIGWEPSLLDDGLHPNAKGHSRIFERIREFVEKKSTR